MFYVKGDDMEDMFKKAAENYELNEELAADWNSIQNALQHDADSVAATPVEEEKKRRFFFFWWLLIIPAAFLIAYTSGLFKSSTSNIKTHKTTVVFQQNNNAATTKNNASNQPINITSNQLSTQIKESAKQKIINKTDENNSVFNSRQSVSKFSSSTVEANNLNKNFTLKNSLTNNFDIAVNKTNDQDKTQSSQINQQSKSLHKNDTTSSTGTSIIENNENETSSKKANNNVADSSSVTMKNKISKAVSSKQKTQKNTATHQSYFYVGLLGNLDLSVIKYQRLSSPGYGGGALIGYHFKNKLSIEAGALYDRKNYYTSGKYFDTKNFNYFTSTNSKVIDAAGNCNMWELPITLNYDLTAHKKFNWFISAGISSYIMHKEYYDFTYEKNGYVEQGGYSYFHTKPDWFSVINVGGGINMQLSNKFSLQAQPYYKIPLSKVGMANLSLTSGGINISIKRAFK